MDAHSESGLGLKDSSLVDKYHTLEHQDEALALHSSGADTHIENHDINGCPELELQDTCTASTEKDMEVISPETRDNSRQVTVTDAEANRGVNTDQINENSTLNIDDAVTVPSDNSAALTDPDNRFLECNDQTEDKTNIFVTGLRENDNVSNVLRGEHEQNIESRCDTSTSFIGYPDENDWKSRMEDMQMSMKAHLYESENWRKKLREKKSEMIRRCAQLESHRIKRLMTEGIVINIDTIVKRQDKGTTEDDADDVKGKEAANGGFNTQMSRQDDSVLVERPGVISRHEVGVMVGDAGVTNEMLVVRNKTTKY